MSLKLQNKLKFVMTKSSKIQEIGGDETPFYHPVI